MFLCNIIISVKHIAKQMKKSLSLLEMIISLLIMSIIVATSLKYGSSAYSQYKYSANQKKLENIQTALKNYFKAHGRLPRPSPYNNLTTTDDKYGKELEINSGCTDMSCREITDTIVYSNKKIQYSKMQANKGATNADKVDGTYNDWVQYTANDYMFSGIVPFKELHLTEKDIIDEYGNFIEYWVGQYMTIKLGEKIIDTSKTNIATSSNTTFFGIPYKSGYNIKYFNETSQNYFPCQKQAGGFPCGAVDNGTSLPSIAIMQNPPTEKLTTTDRSANNFISNENEIVYLLPPYGLRIKDIATDKFVDNVSNTAFVLVSHGANTTQTCGIVRKNFDINTYNNLISITDNNKKYEAQNCIDATNNITLNIAGRDNSTAKGQEFLFYTGTKTDFFDDQIAYSSLSSLLLD